MKRVIEYTDIKYITFLKSTKQFESINELILVFDSKSCNDKGKVLAALLERESIMSTGIGFGIAIPHVRSEAVKKLSFAIGISKKGIEYDSLDKKPVHIVISVLARKQQHYQYLSLLSKIVGPLKNNELKDSIISSNSVEEVWDILKNNFD